MPLASFHESSCREGKGVINRRRVARVWRAKRRKALREPVQQGTKV